ncbi:8443_t:CDS:2, partial [Ambispora leptoticha]
MTNEKLSAIEVPNIEICGYGSDVEIIRCVFTMKDRTSEIQPGCASFLYRKPLVGK